MVVEKLFVADLQKVSGTSEKKICAAGVTRILTESAAMMGEYEHLWAQLLQALIGLFELPEDDSIPADEHFIEIEDTPGRMIIDCFENMSYLNTWKLWLPILSLKAKRSSVMEMTDLF